MARPDYPDRLNTSYIRKEPASPHRMQGVGNYLINKSLNNMNELIKIERREGQNIVSARKLHQLLNVKSRFNDWIGNRLAEYQFRKGIDFTKISVKSLSSGRPQTDYVLTLDTAKELSMLEKTEQGRFVRGYFIECEKRLYVQTGTENKDLRLKARYCDLILQRCAINKELASIRYRLRKTEQSPTSCYLPVFRQTELFTA